MVKSLPRLCLSALALLLSAGLAQGQSPLKSQLTQSQSAVFSKYRKTDFSFAPSSTVRRASTNVIEPNWTCGFDTDDEFSLFTVLDNNNDGRTWAWNRVQKLAQTYSGYDNGNDDWLVTPPLHLVAGKEYTVSFTASNFSTMYLNSFEVKWGSAPTAAALTNTLVETTTPGNDMATYSVQITPTADGNYYIGFHDNTTKKDQGRILIDNIFVGTEVVATAPDSVTSLTAKAGDRGAMTANLSFVSPGKAIDGTAISSVDSIRISRDGNVIGKFGETQAGTALTFADSNVPFTGVHKYGVVAFLDGKEGNQATVDLYVGQDVPSYPRNVVLYDNGDNLRSTWDAFTETGVQGKYLNPDHVKVSFFNVIQGEYRNEIGDSLTSSAPGATSAVIPVNPEESDDGYQKLMFLAARAEGDGGRSGFTATSSLVVGPTFTLPFAENFAGGGIDNHFAWTEDNYSVTYNDAVPDWRSATFIDADGDGGCAVWSSYTDNSGDEYSIAEGDEASINLPKVTLQGAASPTLAFQVYAVNGDEADLAVIAETPDGLEHPVDTFDLSNTAVDGWSTRSVDLSRFTNERYIMLKFRGIASGTYSAIGLDDIRIFDQYDNDLSVLSLGVPSRITTGKTGDATVVVKNYGRNNVNGYSVVLYANDTAVDTVVVSSPLASLATDTIHMQLPVAINETAAQLDVKAVAVLDGEQNEADNTSELKTVVVDQSQYGKVSDLTAVKEGSSVKLNWTEPAAGDPVEVTEDFENYSPFSTEMGDWKLVDGDKGYAGSLFYGYTYPGEGTPFAFEAFNPQDITKAFNVLGINPGLTPHSGAQFAAAPFAYNRNNRGVDASNWIISPELPGKAQTIKFYVFNTASSSSAYAETFDVGYSAAGNDTTDFVVVKSGVADGTNTMSQRANWKEFTVDLPEGTKYFAIHHTTKADDSYLFGIDDITYTAPAPGTYDSITAYNIYRDGRQIATVGGDVVSFTDNSTDGSHIYNVTVVYISASGKVNESGFSNDASTDATAITEVKMLDNDGSLSVYTVDGRRVAVGSKSLTSLPAGLYIVNGRKYIVR